eukprot:PhF_6_TR13447/c0_g1_i3/m.21497
MITHLHETLSAAQTKVEKIQLLCEDFVLFALSRSDSDMSNKEALIFRWMNGFKGPHYRQRYDARLKKDVGLLHGITSSSWSFENIAKAVDYKGFVVCDVCNLSFLEEEKSSVSHLCGQPTFRDMTSDWLLMQCSKHPPHLSPVVAHTMESPFRYSADGSYHIDVMELLSFSLESLPSTATTSYWFASTDQLDDVMGDEGKVFTCSN